MQRNAFLSLLTTAGAAICWWPLLPTPNLELPPWLPLALIALLTALATTLSEGLWARFIACSVLGTAIGLISGLLLWPPDDPIAAAYIPVVFWIAVLLAALASLIAALIARKLTASGPRTRRMLWTALAVCLLIAPATLVLTPPLTAFRIARTEHLARQRFLALKTAVELTAQQNAAPACNAASIRQHYSGPPFSETDWRFIVGNAVHRDRYAFAILCDPDGSYTLSAQPARLKQDGTKLFCTDESGRIGCRLEYGPSHRNACVPCAQ